MFSERFQILLSKEQRSRLDEESRRTGRSIATLIRDAVDAHYRIASASERRRAYESFADREVPFVEPARLRELIDSRFDEGSPKR